MIKAILNRLASLTQKAPAAYYSRASALTRDFGDGGVYEERHYCTLEPAENGTFNVYARISNVTDYDQMKDHEARLLAGNLPVKEAIEAARRHVEEFEKSHPFGPGRGEVMPASGQPPQDRGPYRWLPFGALEPAPRVSGWILGPLDP